MGLRLILMRAAAPGSSRSARPSACAPPGSRSGARCRWRSRSTTRRLFSASVLPLAVRSTMPSTSPVSGASSTEPFTSTISAWRPVSAKCSAATRGYLVAMRTRPRRRRASPIGSPPVGRRHDHLAAAEAQVEQLVDLPGRLLEQHVLAGDPDVGRAVLHVGRHVARAHGHDPDVLEQQLSVVRAHLGGVDPEPVQQVERVGEERSARHRDGEPLAHPSASSAAWARCTRCTSSASPHAGRSRPKRPISSS